MLQKEIRWKNKKSSSEGSIVIFWVVWFASVAEVHFLGVQWSMPLVAFSAFMMAVLTIVVLRIEKSIKKREKRSRYSQTRAGSSE